MTTEFSRSIFNIKIQDTYIVSVDDLCALNEYDQHVHITFDLLPTNAFSKYFKTSFLLKFYILPPTVYFCK